MLQLCETLNTPVFTVLFSKVTKARKQKRTNAIYNVDNMPTLRNVNIRGLQKASLLVICIERKYTIKCEI